MALIPGNLTKSEALLSPTGVKATSANFIDPYTYAQQFSPDLLKEMYMKNGKGRITKFSSAIGTTRSFASDSLQHSEIGRLHQISEAVTFASDLFTCQEAHNLRVKDIIMISDGAKEWTAVVSNANSTTTFTAESQGAAFDFAGAVSLFAYSNTFGKGEGNFTEGKQWSPEMIYNYPQIIKEFYSINESDMAHISWVEAPQYEGGHAWHNVEMGRTLDLYDNKIELTHIFGRRSIAGSDAATGGFAKGMKGLVQQVEERGNLGNEYISTKDHLYQYAYRIKQQGDCRTATIWADHQQMVYFSDIAAGLNAGYAAGANYGMFQNKKDMAISMDFKTIYVAGVTFHITPLGILDDPSLLGSTQFKATSLACLIIPSGDKMVTEEGNSVARPYFSTAYRRKDNIDRYRKVEIFGGNIGTPHKTDDMQALCKTEQSNQVIAANNFTVVSRKAGFYTSA